MYVHTCITSPKPPLPFVASPLHRAGAPLGRPRPPAVLRQTKRPGKRGFAGGKSKKKHGTI